MSHLEDNSCIVCLPPHSDAGFHYFPENLERRLSWIQALGLINVDVDFYCNKQICHRHFSAESYTDCQRRILKETTIPQTVLSTTSSIPRYLSCFVPKTIIISQSTQHQQLIRLLRNKKRKLCRLEKKAKEYRNNIMKLSDLEEMTNGIFKRMSPKMQQFLITQIRHAKLPTKHRTWTVEEQIKSLIFLQKQTNSYELLRRLLPLPSPTDLDHLLNKMPFKPGINEKIFEHLGKCLKSYKRKQRICSLVFGEIPLRKCLQYNPSFDTIEGVVDLGRCDRSNRIADRALVFMVQGVVAKWKQPVAYYFTNTQLRSETLEMILRTVIDALQRIGVKVIVTICDLNTFNIATLLKMESTKSDPFFMHNGKRIFTMFNPPHLLKATRNHFYKYPIKCTSVPDEDDGPLTAHFADIRAVYELDLTRERDYRFFRNHTSDHFGPMKLSTMKLSIATRIFSRSVAAQLNLHHILSTSNGSKIKDMFSETLEGTAVFVMFLDRLFDSFNWISTMKSDYPNCYPLRTPLTNKSKHSQFWTEAYKCIENWTFVGAKRRPLVQDGWLMTISAMKGVWQRLQSYGIKKLDTRLLNCDSLDNLFETIRTGCNCKNNQPTIQQFVAGLKIQIANGLHYDPVDHEKDSYEVLSNLRGFFEVEQVQNTRLVTTDNNFRIIKKIIDGSSIISVVQVSSEIARKVLENNCAKCKSILSSNTVTDSKLIYPSEKLIITVGHGITHIEKILPTIWSHMELWKTLSNTLREQLDLVWVDCDLHTATIRDCIVDVVCCLGIRTVNTATSTV